MHSAGFVFLPLTLGLIFPCTFVITYVTAIYMGHANIGMSYISDAGSHAPESCIFSQLLNMGAALMVAGVYARYRQLMDQEKPSIKLKKASLYTGITSAIGISLVGNFQFISMPIIHGIGAFLCFGVGIISLWIQVECTKHENPETSSYALLKTRWFLAFISTVSFILTIIGAGVSFTLRGGMKSINNYQVGYDWFLLGCINEWIMAFSMSLFILTFVREANSMDIIPPKVEIRLINKNSTFNEDLVKWTHKFKPCTIL